MSFLNKKNKNKQTLTSFEWITILTPIGATKIAPPEMGLSDKERSIRMNTNILKEYLSQEVKINGFLEIRVVKSSQGTVSGYFDDADAATIAVQHIENGGYGQVESVYHTINKIKSGVKSRSYNVLKNYSKNTTIDDEIERLTTLLIDIDPQRPSGTSANDEDHHEAINLATRIHTWLIGNSIPALLADSGNGAHVKIQINEDPSSASRVQRILKEFAKQFNTEKCLIDLTVFNPSRISKVYGTTVRKGSEISHEGIRHRKASVIAYATSLDPVPLGIFDLFLDCDTEKEQELVLPANLKSLKDYRHQQQSNDGIKIEQKMSWLKAKLDGWQVEYKVKNIKNVPELDTQLYITCPFNPNHKGTDCFVGVHPKKENAYVFHCSHNSCVNNHWHEFRSFYEKDYKKMEITATDAVTIGKTEINVNLDPSDQIENINQAIKQEESKMSVPTLFRSGMVLHRQLDKASGKMKFNQIESKKIFDVIDKYVVFRHYKNTPHGTVASVRDCPTGVLRRLESPSRWDLPQLNRIASVPYFTKAGQLINTPGYNEENCVYYEGMELNCPEPTEQNVQEAKDLLADLVYDFPFSDKTSHANYYALLILPFIRDMVPGSTPIHAIMATRANSGKGYLAQAFGQIVTGMAPAAQAEIHDQDEWRKVILAQLRELPPYVILDNISHVLNSSALANALTTDYYEDRILGKSEKIQVPVRCVWVLTGNNLRANADMKRRMIYIRLLVPKINPSNRKNTDETQYHIYKKYGLNFKTFTIDYQVKLRESIILLIRNWINSGMKRADTNLASFEDWSQIMGGILKHNGIEGFGEDNNMNMEEMDSYTEEANALIDYLGDNTLNKTFTSYQILDIVNKMGFLVESMHKSQGKGVQSTMIKLGFILHHLLTTDKYELHKTREKITKSVLYTVKLRS